MRCPRCGSDDLLQYRRPKPYLDLTLRRHRCQACALIFLSVQTAVDDPKLVEELLEAFEA